jgi:hypothetical protein
MATVVFPEVFNNSISTIDGAISDSATTINVASAAALGLDNSTVDALLVIVDRTTYRSNPIITPETSEIIQVNSISTNALAVTRGVDGSSAKAFSDNDIIVLRIVADHIQQIYAALTDGTDSLNIGALTMNATEALITSTTNPHFKATDTTNTVSIQMTALDTTGRMGTTTAHPLHVYSHNTLVASYDSSQNGTYAGDVSVGGMLNLGTPTELTIASGAITVTKSYHTVDTELNASSDDLATINGGSQGDILVLNTVSNVRDVVVKDLTGNIRLDGSSDFTLSHPQDKIVLLFDTSNIWVELSRGNMAS